MYDSTRDQYTEQQTYLDLTQLFPVKSETGVSVTHDTNLELFYRNGSMQSNRTYA